MGETLKRLISAMILVPLLVFCIHYPGWYYLQLYALGFVLIYLGIAEYYKFSNRGDEGKPFHKIGLFYTILIFTIYYLQLLYTQDRIALPEQILNYKQYFISANSLVVPVLVILFVHSFVIQILSRPLDGAIYSVSSTISGVIYLGITTGSFLVLLSLKNGVFYIWLIAGLTFLTDGGAYFGGRFLGRHPAGLKISPKKTWEGYITGLLTAIVYTISLKYVWFSLFQEEIPMSTFELLIFSPIYAVISVIGDLAESSMKRDAKMKDSDSVIPGHGGVLDLADAVLITIPFGYYYLVLKELMGYPI
jgi:phosphatidate cytidylyltransferase